jgi:hypothetical protein
MLVDGLVISDCGVGREEKKNNLTIEMCIRNWKSRLHDDSKKSNLAIPVKIVGQF